MRCLSAILKIIMQVYYTGTRHRLRRGSRVPRGRVHHNTAPPLPAPCTHQPPLPSAAPHGETLSPRPPQRTASPAQSRVPHLPPLSSCSCSASLSASSPAQARPPPGARPPCPRARRKGRGRRAERNFPRPACGTVRADCAARNSGEINSWSAQVLVTKEKGFLTGPDFSAE